MTTDVEQLNQITQRLTTGAASVREVERDATGRPVKVIEYVADADLERGVALCLERSEAGLPVAAEELAFLRAGTSHASALARPYWIAALERLEARAGAVGQPVRAIAAPAKRAVGFAPPERPR
jgi:predicted homoserine dehydrogenase-like protein